MEPRIGPVELMIIAGICFGLVILLAAVGAAIVVIVRKNKKHDNEP